MRIDDEEAPLVVTLWGQQWTRDELLARVGRLEQVAGMGLVEGGDGAERGVRLLRCATGRASTSREQLQLTLQLTTPEEVSDGKR